MNRIGIFSFYDSEGIVDLYIDYLLKELNLVINRLIIVVNGKIDEVGYKIFRKYTDEIIVRENRGFDAGAYADILLNYLSRNELKEYDELILCNDTFYGPFISMQKIFKQMSEKKIDFWGINIVDSGLLSHIQSYFLVFKKKVLLEGFFLEYVKNNINCNEDNITNVYGVIESGLFKELVIKGYKYDSYVNTNLHNIYRNAFICMKKYGIPIMKKKSMCLSYNDYSSQLRNLKYILENTDYNIEWILENAKRKYAFEGSLEDVYFYEDKNLEQPNQWEKSIISEKELIKWINNNPFYIFGEGIFARQLFMLYFKGNSKFLGFIVSKKNNIKEKEIFGYPVITIADIDKMAKIVVGVNKKHILEIQKELGESERILYLW